jgi:hypothetical protein
MNDTKPKSKRGGKRPGAGRPPGSRNLASTAEIKSISALARTHTAVAMKTLATIASKGESEAARVSAATQILDRGYGKPTQHIETPGLDEAAGMVSLEITTEERGGIAQARKIAFVLAIAQRRIANKSSG